MVASAEGARTDATDASVGEVKAGDTELAWDNARLQLTSSRTSAGPTTMRPITKRVSIAAFVETTEHRSNGDDEECDGDWQREVASVLRRCLGQTRSRRPRTVAKTRRLAEICR